MQHASPDESIHAAICASVALEFTKLKEWLSMRLQRQEELLEGLSHTQNCPDDLESKGAAVKDSICPHCKKVIMIQQVSPAWEYAGTDQILKTVSFEGPLRKVASCGASEASVQDVPLPGCATEVATDDPSEQTESKNLLAVGTDTYTSDSDSKSRSFQEHDLQAKLMDVFDQMDLDRSGCIDKWEFTEAFQEVGLPHIQAFNTFSDIDRSKNGVVDRVEWLHVVEQAARSSDEELEVLCKFVERLADRQKTSGIIYASNRARRRLCCIIRHDATFRMSWDVFMVLLLFYISIMLPYSLGFGQNKVLELIDFVLDLIFCVDVVLNFRTTYMDNEDAIIVDGKRIALKYLKSWFVLDFMSSVPFDVITAGVMPNLTPARFLKLGKILKVLRLLRISKQKMFEGTEFMLAVEEYTTTKTHHTILRVLKLMLIAFVLAHWLACFGAAVDTSSLDSYFEGKIKEPSEFQKYIATLYWAMTTLSTVGYGDFLPQSDSERIYAMFAMVIGGAFYGFIVGSVTSIVADMDLNYRAFFSRMDLIQSWLDRHTEIPKSLRRRVRKHFKLTLSAKSVMDDSSIITELSPALRADLAYFVVHEKVRNNPIFASMSSTALANIVEVLEKTHCNANEFIVKVSDPGVAMYILIEGVARYDKGRPWSPPGADVPSNRFQQLIAGDSFGEEIIFDLAEVYSYTIVTVTACAFHLISEDGFKDQYRNMPELRDQMYANFMRTRGLPTVDARSNTPSNALARHNSKREKPFRVSQLHRQLTSSTTSQSSQKMYHVDPGRPAQSVLKAKRDRSL